jgi:hypothetical protein
VPYATGGRAAVCRRSIDRTSNFIDVAYMQQSFNSETMHWIGRRLARIW